MTEIFRQSPVSFGVQSTKTESRNLWNVVLEYQNETSGQYLVDLSHLTRWDVQSSDLSKIKPGDVAIPKTPGESVLSKGILINRMNGTQASVWHVTKDMPDLPDELAYTETTDATVALAIIGDKAFSVAEKLSSLDFLNPNLKAPFLLQGPFSHVPCQIVALSKGEKTDGLLLTCSRGYARDMVHAILDAGSDFNLSPAGEEKFTSWISQLNK